MLIGSFCPWFTSVVLLPSCVTSPSTSKACTAKVRAGPAGSLRVPDATLLTAFRLYISGTEMPEPVTVTTIVLIGVPFRLADRTTLAIAASGSFAASAESDPHAETVAVPSTVATHKALRPEFQRETKFDQRGRVIE